jgi:hypothetical protein
VVGRLPVELFEEFDGGGFLAFETIGIHGVEQVNGPALNEFVQHFHAAVEVGAELAGDGAVVERLRELTPRDFAVGNEDEAPHAAAGGISSHRSGGVAGGGAGDPAKPFLAGEGGGGGHARVFEGGGGVHALMLGLEGANSSGAGTAREIIEGGIPFPQRDGVVAGLEVWKQFAEAPDAAGVGGSERGLAVAPEILERLGSVACGLESLGSLPAGEGDFEQVAAVGTAEVRGGMVGLVAALDTAQAGGGLGFG